MKNFRFLSILLCLSLVFGCLTFPVRATESQPETQTETSADTEPTIPDVKDMPFGTVSIYNGCRTIEGMVPLAGSDRKLETAQSAFLYEVNTGTVVYAYNPDMKVTAGGLVKLVNAAVVLEKVELDEIVTLTGDIYNYGSGLNYNLRRDEQMSVETLLYIMLLYGANDAAIGLADYVAGNQMNFTQLMNEWVKNIGCTSTEFGNVHGLTSANCSTTARDMAKIVREAVKNETFRELFGTIEYDMDATNKSEARATMHTSNYMLDNYVIKQFYDKRVTGGVQTYETSSGACMAITATSSDESMEYIGVVMGCVRVYAENGWQPITYGNLEEMTTMLKMGFNDYKVNRILYNGMTLSQVTVDGGECSAVAMVKENVDSVVPSGAQMNNLSVNLTVRDGGLSAPISAGDEIGTVSIWYRNSCMGEALVYSMGEVRASGNTGVTIRSTAVRSDGGDSGIWSVIGTICVIVLGLVAAYLVVNAYMRSRIRAQRRRRRANRRRIR